MLCGSQDEGPKRRTQKLKVTLQAQLYCWEKLFIGNRLLQNKPKPQSQNSKLNWKLETKKLEQRNKPGLGARIFSGTREEKTHYGEGVRHDNKQGKTENYNTQAGI